MIPSFKNTDGVMGANVCVCLICHSVVYLLYIKEKKSRITITPVLINAK